MKALHQIIKRPLITEKSNLQREAGQTVTFEVARDANKIEIKQAIEKAFKVKVKDVRTMVTAGKAKRVGRTVGEAFSSQEGAMSPSPRGPSISSASERA